MLCSLVRLWRGGRHVRARHLSNLATLFANLRAGSHHGHDHGVDTKQPGRVDDLDRWRFNKQVRCRSHWTVCLRRERYRGLASKTDTDIGTIGGYTYLRSHEATSLLRRQPQAVEVVAGPVVQANRHQLCAIPEAAICVSIV